MPSRATATNSGRNPIAFSEIEAFVPDDLLVGDHHAGYCSDVCARSALQWRDFRVRSSEDRAFAAAGSVVFRAQNPAVACAQCQKKFRPTQRSGKFCSPACSQEASAIALRQIPDRECKVCTATFRPERASQFLCSEVCKYEAIRHYRCERTCVGCGHSFEATGPKAMYCSDGCKTVVIRFRNGKNLPKRLTPPLFDYLVRMAA